MIGDLSAIYWQGVGVSISKKNLEKGDDGHGRDEKPESKDYETI